MGEGWTPEWGETRCGSMRSTTARFSGNAGERPRTHLKYLSLKRLINLIKMYMIEHTQSATGNAYIMISPPAWLYVYLCVLQNHTRYSFYSHDLGIMNKYNPHGCRTSQMVSYVILNSMVCILDIFRCQHRPSFHRCAEISGAH